MSSTQATKKATSLMRALLIWERQARSYDIKVLPEILARINRKDETAVDYRVPKNRQGSHRGKQKPSKPRSITL